MHKLFKISFSFFAIVVLLIISSSSMAQDDVLETDTVYESIVTPPVEQSDDTTLFNNAEQKRIELREVDKKELEALKSDEAFWYANAEPKKKEATTPFWQLGWVKTLTWIIIIGSFIAIIILFLSSSNVFLFRRKSKKLAAAEEQDQEVQEDIYTLNFAKEIQKAIDKKDYRLAIRYLYLKTLKELSDKNIIRYRQERTNQDYVMEVFGTSYYKDFFKLTRHFEYAWYGKFDIGEEHFRMIHSQFNHFKTGKAA